VAMGFCPVVDVLMASIHSGFPIGAQLAFPLPPSFFCCVRQSSISYFLACVCKKLCISVEQLMERGSARLVRVDYYLLLLTRHLGACSMQTHPIYHQLRAFVISHAKARVADDPLMACR
jgi:hypothetical protein